MSDPAYQLLDANVSWFLILAHPGHELRAYHFLERVCPFVAVMTDGSGSIGTPRVDESRDSYRTRPSLSSTRRMSIALGTMP